MARSASLIPGSDTLSPTATVEATVLRRDQAHLGIDGHGAKVNVLSTTDNPECSLEACGITDGKQLFRIRASSLATHLDGGTELEVQHPVACDPVTLVPATRDMGSGRVERFGHRLAPLDCPRSIRRYRFDCGELLFAVTEMSCWRTHVAKSERQGPSSGGSDKARARRCVSAGRSRVVVAAEAEQSQHLVGGLFEVRYMGRESEHSPDILLIWAPRSKKRPHPVHVYVRGALVRKSVDPLDSQCLEVVEEDQVLYAHRCHGTVDAPVGCVRPHSPALDTGFPLDQRIDWRVGGPPPGARGRDYPAGSTVAGHGRDQLPLSQSSL